MLRTPLRRTLPVALLLALSSVAPAGADEPAVELQVNADDASGQALPCRIHLTDPSGKPVQAGTLPFWKDHFCCDGRVTLKLAPGKYRYEIERGPEHQRVRGALELKAGREHSLHVRIDRIADLK